MVRQGIAIVFLPVWIQETVAADMPPRRYDLRLHLVRDELLAGA